MLVYQFLRRAAEVCPPMRSQEVGTPVLIYVALLDEGADVWRPVKAEVRGEGCYRITGEQPDDEEWRFKPGSVVRCKEHRFQDGSLGLVAAEQVS